MGNLLVSLFEVEWKNEPARSGPGSREEEAVEEHCHPDTYTVSRYFAI